MSQDLKWLWGSDYDTIWTFTKVQIKGGELKEKNPEQSRMEQEGVITLGA